MNNQSGCYEIRYSSDLAGGKALYDQYADRASAAVEASKLTESFLKHGLRREAASVSIGWSSER